MKRAIVLSGGGAKGSYQIGFWRAIKKMHIKYDIVTGTSVGALNGLFFAQKDYLKALLLWRKMNFNVIFEEDELKKYNNISNSNDMIKMFGKNAINGGIDVNKLDRLVRRYANFNKFKRKRIDFGIVTYNLTNLKPVYMVKEKMTKDNFIDFVMASASCYPFFQKKKIGNKYYIDGGVYNNLPIDLAIELGADEIIAVNLKAPGIIPSFSNNKNNKITYIEPKNTLGSFLAFNKESAIKGIKYGYNDTMKKFNKLDGNIYTFKKNHISNYYNKNKKEIASLFLDLKISKSFTKINYIRILDYLGKSLKLDDTKIYNIKKYNRELIKSLDNVTPINTKTLKNIISEKKILDEISTSLVKYLYLLLKDNKTKELDKYKILFNKEVVAAFYLYYIDGCK